MNRNFTQTIAVECDDPDTLVEMLVQWDRDQATGDIMGYMGSRLLADRANPGRYVIEADFGVIDPNVSAVEEAERNNDRPETQAWAERLRAAITGEPEYRHYDELYRTG
jgi:hypothetical protein